MDNRYVLSVVLSLDNDVNEALNYIFYSTLLCKYLHTL